MNVNELRQQGENLVDELIAQYVIEMKIPLITGTLVYNKEENEYGIIMGAQINDEGTGWLHSYVLISTMDDGTPIGDTNLDGAMAKVS